MVGSETELRDKRYQKAAVLYALPPLDASIHVQTITLSRFLFFVGSQKLRTLFVFYFHLEVKVFFVFVLCELPIVYSHQWWYSNTIKAQKTLFWVVYLLGGNRGEGRA